MCISFIMLLYPCVYREHFNRLFSVPLKPRFIPVYTGNTNACSGRISILIGLSLCVQGTLIGQ